jgi:meiotically up-regulated gene 157 (Mug157) protein
MKRKEFLKNNGILIGGLTLLPSIGFSQLSKTLKYDFISNRPPLSERTFVSDAVEETISSVKARIADEELAWMFENCYPNTLDTTVDFEYIDGKPDTFIITGDIDAMWLRDSTAQVWPYMQLIDRDENLREMIKGLVNRQVKCVLKDPYANAFYKDLTKESQWASDQPSPIPGVHERKWEIDSLCYAVRLSHRYYELTGDKTIFDGDWIKAMRLIVQTFRTEQRKDGKSPYYFIRRTTAMIDAPTFGGTGRPARPNGMICSMFRPSDDATMYPYLVPSNVFAVISLRQLSDIFGNVLFDSAFATECDSFASEVGAAIRQFAIQDHLEFGKIYAYEIDGFGNSLFMDDANVPSLISLSYLGVHKPSDAVYRNTRNYILSDSNPWYLKGSAAEGMASPHTGKEKIWPMGFILRAITSEDLMEIKYCLKMLKATHAGTGFMHEAFHKDNPEDYNRSWFAWANTLFGELVIKLAAEYPEVLNEA